VSHLLDRHAFRGFNETAVRSELRSYIINNFLLGNAADFSDGTELMEAGILDSTAAMELVAFIEATFRITIEEQEIIPENLNSIDDICDFIRQKSN
jgi:acyl carrier protein